MNTYIIIDDIFGPKFILLRRDSNPNRERPRISNLMEF